MKKLVLTIALVLSAGNLFPMNFGGSLLNSGGALPRQQQPQNIQVGGAQTAWAANPGPYLDANCIPLGYRTTRSGSTGGTGGMSMAYVPQRIGFGNPDYDAYANCMRKKGLQPVQELWR